jgi:putative peptide zinc metalloprotease protein
VQASDGAAPRLAEGIELVGEYKESGFKKAPYIARRGDGQTIQLAELLYRIAEHADGRRDYEAIAQAVSEDVGRGLSADNVRALAEERLRPLGVLAQADGSSPQLEKADPMLALKLRAAVVPPRLTRALTTVFRVFFFPPVVVAVVAGLVAVDAWLFFVHGAAQSTRELLYNPVLLLMVLGLLVLATALHEIGHASALRYGGGVPGAMGAGIYIVWPAFYTDVTDAYRLSRAGRLRTDLGGVYFNALFVLLIAGAYALTGFEPLLVLIPIQHFQIIQQMLPFLRLDGYYVLSDLTGVPDLFGRIKPTLKSALPGQESDKRVEELKPWVRVVTTTWVVALIPILVFVFGLMAFNAPRMFATAWDSFLVQNDKLRDAWGNGEPLGAGAAGIQALALVLPVAGMTYSFGRIAVRIVKGAWGWSEGAPLRRGLVAVVTAGLAATTAYVLIPNGDYRPIQTAERGTLQGGLRQFAEVATGRPGLTEKRKDELGGAPTERSKRGVGPSEEENDDTSPTSKPEQPAQTETTDTTDTTEQPAQTETTETTDTTDTTDTTTTTTATTTTTDTTTTGTTSITETTETTTP